MMMIAVLVAGIAMLADFVYRSMSGADSARAAGSSYDRDNRRQC